MRLGRKQWQHQNHHGITYQLWKKNVTLRAGKQVMIYFFRLYGATAPDGKAKRVYKFPEGYTLRENPRNGFLTLVRNYTPDEGEEED